MAATAASVVPVIGSPFHGTGGEVFFDQGSNDWLLWRDGLSTASEAPVIKGLSPFNTPWQLWMVKTKQRPPLPPHPGMLRGHQLEPIARQLQEDHTFIETPPTCFEAVIDGTPFGASLDGFADLGNGRYLNREIKAPANPDHECAIRGEVPLKYQDQIIQQAIVISVAKDVPLDSIEHEYVSYRPGHPKGELVVVPFAVDLPRAIELIATIKAFWQHVLDVTPPAGDAFEQAAYLWREAMEDLEEAKAIEAALRDSLTGLVPDGVKRKEGNGVVVTRTERAPAPSYGKVVDNIRKGGLVPEAQLDQMIEDTLGKSSSGWKVTIRKGADAATPIAESVEKEAVTSAVVKSDAKPDWAW